MSLPFWCKDHAVYFSVGATRELQLRIHHLREELVRCERANFSGAMEISFGASGNGMPNASFSNSCSSLPAPGVDRLPSVITTTVSSSTRRMCVEKPLLTSRRSIPPHQFSATTEPASKSSASTMSCFGFLPQFSLLTSRTRSRYRHLRSSTLTLERKSVSCLQF